MDEILTTLPAYFDGENIRLRKPFAIRPHTNLLVTILDAPSQDAAYQNKVDRFLALEGFYENDPQFDQAIDELNKAWDTWTTNESV